MSGYEVCQQIRKDAAMRILPVVMVTALDPGEERIKGLEAGADDFLTKPVNQPELVARVRSLLRIKSLYDQAGGKTQRVERHPGDTHPRAGGAAGSAQPLAALSLAPGRGSHRRGR